MTFYSIVSQRKNKLLIALRGISFLTPPTFTSKPFAYLNFALIETVKAMALIWVCPPSSLRIGKTMKRQDLNLKGKPTAKFASDMSACLIKPRAMTPFRQKITHYTAYYFAIAAGWVSGAYLAINVLNEICPWWALAAIPAVFFGVKYGVNFALTKLLSKGRNVRITEQKIMIQKWFFFWEKFNRMHEHGFSYRKHPKGGKEKELLAHRVREESSEGKVKRSHIFYQDSFEIIFEYLGQPIVLMSAYGEGNAIQIIARCQAVDEVIKSANGTNGALSLDAQGDWGEQAGSLGRAFH